jgi:hypothetical protein
MSMLVFWVVTPCGFVGRSNVSEKHTSSTFRSALKMKTVCFSKTLVSTYKFIKGKGKGVPLHAMEAHGGRGGIAPTHT